MNTRPNMLANRWCICKINLNLVILASNDQQVTLIFTEHDKTFAISAIYASTKYLIKRQLWHNLSALHSQFSLLWCFIGDFNSILETCEHRGRITSVRLPIEDFKAWSELNNLIHLPTKGAEFTWPNGRGGMRHIKRRLDRAFCNQVWLDLSYSMFVSTLIKHKFDHFPLFLEMQVSNETFASQFKFMRMWTTHSNCKNIVKDS